MAVAGGPGLPLSFDWEDWYQLCVAPFDDPQAPLRYEDRLAIGTEAALGLCERLGAKATWFCLADQARRHPELLRRIMAEGHRIALHGLHHRRLGGLVREGFRQELRAGRAVLEDLTGAGIEGFRAPEWSLRGPAEDWWRELEVEGFRYDASRAPLAGLGRLRWPRRVHPLGGLLECPPPVAGPVPFALPLWGWGARVLPEAFLRSRFRALARSGAGTPLVVHPWELDEGQPPLEGAPRLHRLAHGAGLRGFRARLVRLLEGVRLLPIEVWLDEAAREGRFGGTLEP